VLLSSGQKLVFLFLSVQPTGDMVPPSQLAKRSCLAHQNNAWKSIKVDGITLDAWVTRLLEDIEEQHGRMGESSGHFSKDIHGQGVRTGLGSSGGFHGNTSDMPSYKEHQQHTRRDNSGERHCWRHLVVPDLKFETAHSVQSLAESSN
jgi:hypothetical protein